MERNTPKVFIFSGDSPTIMSDERRVPFESVDLTTFLPSKTDVRTSNVRLLLPASTYSPFVPVRCSIFQFEFLFSSH